MLAGFAQFLHASGRWERLCESAPFAYASNNAPEVNDILGTLVLGILSGANRFAHLSALRHDTLAMELFGMTKVASEDSVRRAIKSLDPAKADAWLVGELSESVRPFIGAAPWILDVDVTVKLLYGRAQEGAAVSYNPAKPGRPSRVHHAFLMAGTRLALDLDVRAGDEHASRHGLDRLCSYLETTAREWRPLIVRGDCGYGNEEWMRRMDALSQPYLFKIRLSKNARKLARSEPAPGEPGWEKDESGWECRETMLKCDTWEKPRRVVVQRRLRSETQLAAAKKKRLAAKGAPKRDEPLLELAGYTELLVENEDALKYEYAVLASNTGLKPAETCRLYRDRGDAENPFDELKNQWGWDGFSVRELAASAAAARLVAIVYNWWSLYTRLVLPGKHRESITSRPRLLGGVARKTEHAGQRHLAVKLTHAACATTKAGVVAAFVFLASLVAGKDAPQLDATARWARVGGRIAEQILAERAARDTAGPPPPAKPT